MRAFVLGAVGVALLAIAFACNNDGTDSPDSDMATTPVPCAVDGGTCDGGTAGD